MGEGEQWGLPSHPPARGQLAGRFVVAPEDGHCLKKPCQSVVAISSPSLTCWKRVSGPVRRFLETLC